MRRNPFLSFHRAAEAAAYPALLIVSMACLAMIVGAVMLLAVMQTAWAFALALLSLIAAIGIVARAFDAAVYDVEEPAAGRAVSPRPLPHAHSEHEAVVPLQRRGARVPRRGPSRKAA
jgi:hypothetical protein